MKRRRNTKAKTLPYIRIYLTSVQNGKNTDALKRPLLPAQAPQMAIYIPVAARFGIFKNI
jgi:hypothetical protein